MANHSPDFQPNKSFFVKEINCEIQEFTHVETKAKHYHILPLAPFNNENSFTLFFKTMPQDSKGVAHILEHTVLCGSEKYPVKAPFFKMLNRSAATFMNAMTGQDYTAYPFATQNNKDYENLLQLYLDSVFHSNLSELDFLQEGWRFEYPNNDTSQPLEYKGVVLNEMRGAMGSEIQSIYQSMLSHVYKDTIYRHNSGGAPADITKLTYAELKDFYDTYYHPSNSIICTYGTYPVEKTQAFISDALKTFQHKNVVIPESFYLESDTYLNKKVTYKAEHFNPEVPEGGDNTFVLNWFCGDNTNLAEQYEMEIFSEMLASPESKLQKFLDQEHVLLSEINGYLNSQRQTLYAFGVKNLKDNEIDTLRARIWEKLDEVKHQEFSKEKMHSLLDNIELDIKEQKSNRMPYSIDLAQAIKPQAMAGKDIAPVFDVETIFNTIRAKIDNNTLISSIFDKYIQPSRTKEFISSANSELQDKNLLKEKEELLARQKQLSVRERDQIVKKAKLLAQKQDQDAQADTQSLDVLPKLLRSDIDAKIDESLFSKATIGKNLIHYENKSGVAYTQMFFDLPFGPQTPYDLLVEKAYYSIFNEQFAFGEFDLEQSDIQRSKHIVEFSVNAQIYHKQINQEAIADKEHVAQLCVRGKNLDTKADVMTSVLCDSFFTARFNDNEQIHHILSTYTENLKDYNNLGVKIMQNSLGQDIEATARLTRDGMSIDTLQQQVQLCERILAYPEAMKQFMSDVDKFHKDIIEHNKPYGPVLRVVSQEETKDKIQQVFADKIKTYMTVDIEQNNAEASVLDTLNKLEQPQGTSGILREIQNELKQQTFQPNNTALVGPGTVAHNFRSYKLDNLNFQEAAALTIAANILDGEYLHKLIREQGGAYGANASLKGGMFAFASWRDPNVTGTFDNFDKALNKFMTDDINPGILEDTIIRIVSNINSITDNRSKIGKSFEQDRSNRKEIRQYTLDAILNVSVPDMKAVISKYLIDKPYQNYTYCGENQKEQLLADSNQSWNIQHITDIQLSDTKKATLKAGTM